MKAYKIGGTHEQSYAGTLKDAHDKGKEYAESGDWRDVEINEVEVPTNKENIIHLLNGWGEAKETGRKWSLTPRLGLTEE